MNRTTFRQRADALTGFGLSVFPLSPMLKIPAISKKRGGNGCLDATRDADTISKWAMSYYRANVGIATGEISGIIVVDLDVKNGWQKSKSDLNAQGFRFPRTVCCRTPTGGWHLYYRWRPGITNSVNSLGSGIDIRSDGGYVVGPMSMTVDGTYEWFIPFAEEEMADLPEWIFERLKPKPEARQRTLSPRKHSTGRLDYLYGLMENAQDGNRNGMLWWVGCRFAERGLLDQAKAELARAARQTGLAEREINRTIQSVSDNWDKRK